MIGLHDEVESDRDALQTALDTERTAHSATAAQLAACQADARAAVARAEELQRREGELRTDFKEGAAEWQQHAEALRGELKQRDAALEAPRQAATQANRESGERSSPKR